MKIGNVWKAARLAIVNSPITMASVRNDAASAAARMFGRMTRRSVVVQRAPIYLYVPAAHQQNWRQYCGRYSACNQPVYFVREEYVRERYEKEHPGRHLGHDKDHPGQGHKDKGHGQGKGKGHDK